MLLLSVQLLPLITTGPHDSHPSAERARTLRTIEFDALKSMTISIHQGNHALVLRPNRCRNLKRCWGRLAANVIGYWQAWYLESMLICPFLASVPRRCPRRRLCLRGIGRSGSQWRTKHLACSNRDFTLKRQSAASHWDFPSGKSMPCRLRGRMVWTVSADAREARNSSSRRAAHAGNGRGMAMGVTEHYCLHAERGLAAR